MTDIRIAAVSYLNTIPFIYGIRQAGVSLRADLLLSPPAGCAKALRDGRADVALLPVAAVPSFPDIDIITPYCIGAHGPVRTVVLLSNTSAENLRKIYLDSHSLTSVRLVRILAREKWGIEPAWETLTDYTLLDEPQSDTGYLLIGDKVFGQEGRFTHSYDLAEQWRDLTGFPFTFAVWAARHGVPDAATAALGKALGYGIRHIGAAVTASEYAACAYAVDYLTHNIDFNLDPRKRRAMELYWQKGTEADPPSPASGS